MGLEDLARFSAVLDESEIAERASKLADRSPRGERRALARLALECLDLTTLEGSDTTERIGEFARKAARPLEEEPTLHAAALCIYPIFVPAASTALRGTDVAVAAVAGGFPSGQTDLTIRLAEIERAVTEGANELDVVMNRGLMLAGDDGRAFKEIVAFRRAAGDAVLKIILETGELGSLQTIRRAALIAMAAGADMIKTSTGKVSPGATPPAAVVIAEAIRDFHEQAGREVGFKASGGIRSVDDALIYMSIISEILGQEWLAPQRFRIGASSLLEKLTGEIREAA